jgi:hypothetical protein
MIAVMILLPIVVDQHLELLAEKYFRPDVDYRHLRLGAFIATIGINFYLIGGL